MGYSFEGFVSCSAVKCLLLLTVAVQYIAFLYIIFYFKTVKYVYYRNVNVFDLVFLDFAEVPSPAVSDGTSELSWVT